MECAIGTSSLDLTRLKGFNASKANTMEDCTPSNRTQSILKGDGWILSSSSLKEPVKIMGDVKQRKQKSQAPQHEPTKKRVYLGAKTCDIYSLFS